MDADEKRTPENYHGGSLGVTRSWRKDPCASTTKGRHFEVIPCLRRTGHRGRHDGYAFGHRYRWARVTEGKGTQ